MRILRLANSNDFVDYVSDEKRAYRYVEQALEALTGEPWETIRKPIQPAENLPDIVDRWVNEFQPDIVYLMVNSYWFNYESVPLKLKRKFGRVGQAVGDVGLSAAGKPWFADHWWFHKTRYFLQATIGGETPYTPEYVLENMEAVIRRVLRHEHVHLVVRSSMGGRERPDLPKKVRERRDVRRKIVADGIERLCAQLNVANMSGKTKRKYNPEERAGDNLHRNERGHAESGAREAAFMVAFWRSLHPDLYPEPDPLPR